MKTLFIFLCLFLSIGVFAKSNAQYEELANYVVMYEMRIADLGQEEKKNTQLIAELSMQKAWYCYQLTNSDSPRLCKISSRNWNTLLGN